MSKLSEQPQSRWFWSCSRRSRSGWSWIRKAGTRAAPSTWASSTWWRENVLLQVKVDQTEPLSRSRPPPSIAKNSLSVLSWSSDRKLTQKVIPPKTKINLAGNPPSMVQAPSPQRRRSEPTSTSYSMASPSWTQINPPLFTSPRWRWIIVSSSRPS